MCGHVTNCYNLLLMVNIEKIKCHSNKNKETLIRKMTSGIINYFKSTLFGSTITPMANKLETDAGAFKDGIPMDEETLLLSMRRKMNQNETAIRNIDEQDLDDMEKDLAFYEKVSLLFLLYGYQSPMFGMQKWNVGHRTKFVETPFIREWAHCNENYKGELIEALLIIQANHVLIKLGLDIENLKYQFSPHLIDMNVHIHPMLKALYILCESLTKVQTKKLIDYMKGQCDLDVEFDCEMFLEIYFIQWFLEDNVVLGDWKKDGSSKEIFCDIEKITAFLKTEDDSLKEKLLKVNIRFNFTKNNLIGKDKCKKDSAKNAVMDNASSSSASTSTAARKNVSNKKEETKVLDVLSPNRDKILPRYDIRKESAGYLLVINQKEFTYNPKSSYKKLLNDRKGTDKDSQDLRETFEKHGYENITKTNLTDSEIIDSVKSVVKRSKDKDSLIVCILSHGIRGQVFGSNCIPVEIDTIKSILIGEELRHKPKILLIQACQVDDQIQRTEFKNLDGDYDLFVAWSAFPGKVSYRDIEKGSWFIQTICKKINDYGNSDHMIDIMTEVSRDLKDKSGPNKETMINIYETNLTKKIFLPRSLQKF